ncbi:MAG: SDR family oxidoreductase [Eubacteriales bacterium]
MKNIIITGSTRGIGLCMAKEFLAAGCNVTLSGRGAVLNAETQLELEKYAGQYIYIACNTQSRGDIESLWTESAQKWGQVDIWINNAGQNCPYEKIWSTDPAFFDKVVDTNLKGVIQGSAIAARNMLQQGGGQIFNMEGLGSDGRIMEKTILYGTTKSALTYFTRGLAKELSGTPVLAGRLSPGMMITDFITKDPDGKESPALAEKRFRYVLNAIGEKPETVAAFLVPRMLANKKNDAHIVWLTNAKATLGFLFAPMRKRKLI